MLGEVGEALLVTSLDDAREKQKPLTCNRGCSQPTVRTGAPERLKIA